MTGIAHLPDWAALLVSLLLILGASIILIGALGLMRLLEGGKVDLDADVSGYLGFNLRNPHFASQAITLRHLLLHTSSLRDDGGYFWPATTALKDVQPAWSQLAGPDGAERLPRLIDAVCARNLDVVTFTSAPAVDAFLTSAIEQGVLDQLLDALRTDVVAAAVGPVTAGPLEAAGVTPIIPERFRMGALIRLVCEHLALHQVTELSTALGPVQIRGRSVVFEGRAGQLAPAPLALFRALAASTGAVLTRKDLMAHLPEAENEHALDMAMSRLRASLPEPRLVATVVKRGYRLNV